MDRVFPWDAALNLPPDQYSQGLRRQVGLAVAQGSFDEAVKAIEEGTGAHVPKRPTEPLSRAIRVDFEEYSASKPMERGSGMRVMSVDGKGVVRRQHDRREATRKAAEASRHPLKTRLSRGEQRHRQRRATVASGYEVDPYGRTAEQTLVLSSPPELPLRV